MPHQSPGMRDSVLVRRFRPNELAEVCALSNTGVLGHESPPDLSTHDLEDIQASYFGRAQDHFWVAEIHGHLMGMIGVVQSKHHTALIRHLRVAPHWQGTDVVGRLVKMALEHCRLHGVLKVILDTPCRSGRAIRSLQEMGFQHTRTLSRDRHARIEFYVNLYSKSPRDHPSASQANRPDAGIAPRDEKENDDANPARHNHRR